MTQYHAKKPVRSLAATVDAVCYRCVLTGLGATAFLAAVSALYLVKSAVGIDLMDGPSPLHGIFF
jgi:hypothetical protein